jgi:hypothetical protein
MNSNGTHNSHEDNGLERWQTTIEIDDNPYLSPRIKKQTVAGVNGAAGAPETAHNEMDLPPVDSGKKSRRRRNALLLCVVALGFVCGALGLYMKYGGNKKVGYRITEKKVKTPGQQTQNATGIEQETTDQATANAINQAREELRKTDAVFDPNAPSATDAQKGKQTGASAGAVFTPYIFPETSPSTGTMAKGTSGEINQSARGGNVSDGARENAGDARQTYSNSRSAGSYSIYVRETEEIGKAVTSTATPGAARELPAGIGGIDRKEVALPTFGAMLPVRTLGAMFTLRNSLVRLQSTRDVVGEGWTVKRGTILVAQQQGSEHDRAFLTLAGFIDPASNRFVRLSGDILGADGGPGLKGKKRKINGRWATVFNRVANGALALGQAALSRGGTAVIMGGPSGVAGDLGLSYNTITRREFVEVQANTPAYVMVTSLPKDTKGIDAEPPKESEGEALTDEELAELLSTGTPDQIKEAMPRMNPEMRKVARIVLGEK